MPDDDAGQREKLSSMFSGSLENQPILRVNLLKKSNKPHNSILSASFRRKSAARIGAQASKASSTLGLDKTPESAAPTEPENQDSSESAFTQEDGPHIQDLRGEPQRKLDEIQAKEAAVEEQPKASEAEHKAKLLMIRNRRNLKNQRVGPQQQVKEKKRLEKDRDRDEKVTATKEADHESLLAIETCRRFRLKLLAAGKPHDRDWFSLQIRTRLANLLTKLRLARNQTEVTDAKGLATTIDLSANNINNQHNKPFYLKIGRVTRELISVATDQRISGGGIMPAGVIHSVDRLLADLNKQLASRRAPQLMPQLFYLSRTPVDITYKSGESPFNADQLDIVIKMIESYAIDTLFLYDIISSLVSILRRIIPNVSSAEKVASSIASPRVTSVDLMSSGSYHCHRTPILPARIYIKMINMLQTLCQSNSDLCYMVFQSNSLIDLSDILSYRLGFIFKTESAASSISGSGSPTAATLSSQAIDRQAAQRNQKQLRSQQQSGATSGGLVSDKSDSSSNYCNDGLRSSEFRKDTDKDDFGAGVDDWLFAEDADLLEKAETYKRTEGVVADMTAGLCKLLATVSETILGRPMVLIDSPDRLAFEQRSRDFISYMVSVGIVDTGSVIMSHIHQQQHNNPQQQSSLTLGSANVMESSSPVAQTTRNSPSIQTSSQSGSATAAASTSIGSAQTTSASSASTGGAALVTNICSTPAATSPTAQQQSPSSSANDKIIYLATSCVRFVSSLVKLLTAKLPADGQDHASERPPATDRPTGDRNEIQDPPAANSSDEIPSVQQDPTQLLATLKMTQLSGVLTLVHDMLVNSFGSLAATYPPNQTGPISPIPHHNIDSLGHRLGLALHSIRLINYVAYIDIALLQSILSADEMLSLQLRHVCGYLMSYLVTTQPDIGSVLTGQHRPITGGSEESSNDQSLARLKSELMNEIILLLGNLASSNRENQLMLKSGRQPTIIELLVALPFDYFSRPNLKLVLMPTLISCAYQNDEICELICPELSLSMLTLFIEDQLLEAQMEGQSQQRDKPRQSSLLVTELTNTRMNSSRWRFEQRFPKSKWLSAKKYLESRLPSKSKRPS